MCNCVKEVIQSLYDKFDKEEDHAIEEYGKCKRDGDMDKAMYYDGKSDAYHEVLGELRGILDEH